MRKLTKQLFTMGTFVVMGLTFQTQAQASAINFKDFKVMEIHNDLKLIKPMSYMKTSGLVWVNPYTRRDGTSVRGHYRTSPDGYCFNNFSGC